MEANRISTLYYHKLRNINSFMNNKSSVYIGTFEAEQSKYREHSSNFYLLKNIDIKGTYLHMSNMAVIRARDHESRCL